MRAAVLGLVAACSSPEPVHLVDAGQGPIEYTLSVPFASTSRADLPTVFIDGVATSSLHETYPALPTDGFRHDVELRYDGHVLVSLVSTVNTASCQEHVGGPVLVVRAGMEALESGDLRYVGDDVETSNGGCIGDAFGIARCYCPGERCVPRITLAEPLFTMMACAPIGPKAAGDSCTLIDDPDGAYDDCGENLACIAGTCTPFCSPDVPEGYPPEVRCR